MKTSAVKALCLATAISSLMTGCATNGASMSPEEFAAVMASSNSKVDSLVGSGNYEEAIKVLGDVAKNNPGKKEPWLRMARVHFDDKNYSQAIVAAEEALQRDGTDRTAKTLRAVSGLRVASLSLADLRGDVDLKGNTKSDAMALVKVMRETLGEEVLVPQGGTGVKKGPLGVPFRGPPATPRQAPATGAPASAPGSAPPAQTGGKPAAPAPATGSGNPFGVLR